MTLSLNPAYNLKAVLKETGIKPDVLRAWERRYGLPMPQRTDGGHRLYSEHDIEVIKWLIARQGEGLSISHAVEMWKEKTSQGQDPLGGISQQDGQTVLPGRRPEFSTVSLPVNGVDELRSQWLSACMNFREIEAENVLSQAFALYPVEFVCKEVLQRGLVEIGARWYENRASVQQEHFASALALRRLDALLMAASNPNKPQTILVGCPVNEWHTFTPMLMALSLRRRGYNVIYLGANIPPQHFVETVQSTHADLVVLAAQQLNTAVSLQEAAALIAEQDIPVSFGGRIFGVHPDLVRRVAGYYLGNHLDGAVNVIENLLTARPFPTRSMSIPEEYALALKEFSARRTQVEAGVDQLYMTRRIPGEYFRDANLYFGDNIIAALSLGNMSYLDSEIEWLKVMLQGHDLQEVLLRDYLENYAAAANQTLSEQSRPLTEWLESQIKTLISK